MLDHSRRRVKRRPRENRRISQDVKLTRREDLVLNLLAARYREGEHEWTMDGCEKSLATLTTKGLVTTRSHNADHRAVYARLTDAGKKLAISDSYVSPAAVKRDTDIADEIARLIADGREAPQLRADLAAMTARAEAAEATLATATTADLRSAALYESEHRTQPRP